MLRAMNRIKSLGMVALLGVTLGAFGCDGGDTDGGKANDNLGPQGQYISDGGAGSTLKISIKGSLTVAGQTPFSVVATDPRGEPLAFIRIFCESERGIAIIEPSSGGVGFESTGPDGSMSGMLGGVTPGSFMLECRGPQGYNLVARERIHITGEVPDGFEGFPGAAGGNLGGGVIIDQSNDEVVVSGFTVMAVSGETNHLDTSFIADCNGDTVNDDPELFGYDDWNITVNNQLDSAITVTRVQIAIQDGNPGVTSNQTVNVPMAGNESAEIQGPLTEFITFPKNYAGSSNVVIDGTFNVRITVSYVTANGDTDSATGRGVITIGPVDHCSGD